MSIGSILLIMRSVAGSIGQKYISMILSALSDQNTVRRDCQTIEQYFESANISV